MPVATRSAKSNVPRESEGSIATTGVSEQLAALLRRYANKGRPLQVSFRELLEGPSGDTRYTHNLHHYPGRLLANIPAFFLSADSLCTAGDVVLDPFCGSGTVAVESLTRGYQCLGADANPLARLLAKVKATPIEPGRLARSLKSIVTRLPESVPEKMPLVLNRDYWFHPHVWKALARLLVAIRATRDGDIRDFFSVTLSSCIRDVSLADPRLSVPVRLRLDQYPKRHPLHEQTAVRLRRLKTIDVEAFFLKRAERNIKMMRTLHQCETLGRYLGTGNDARALRLGAQPRLVRSGSVDLVLTSPPYVGAQKYVRASSLSMTWLGMCEPTQLRSVEDQNIGREHYDKELYKEYLEVGLPRADDQLKRIHRKNPLRAHIAGNYLREMRDSLKETARVLRKGGHLLLVIGEGSVCGERFDTPQYLSALSERTGLKVRLSLIDPIRSRSLMTKRHKTAGLISAESVLLFEKG
jgi:hypothetical protein